ncbi:MAG TPA: VWA domain-containing protein [Planctomycetota bacterium]|nr:VWA domain-containing protein [Planctomycetota bacterium]HRR80554.1 VWA domain-containing protein [Planctomycetota bacterium]HRT93303.1 VWA domain-containing protein [Planctomycetota bacterium]
MWGFTPAVWSFVYAGLAALSIPVIIHMLQSPTARIVDFPCIRFLKACQRKAVRRTRLKNILLMLLRMALILLIALGMAKCTRTREQTDVLPDAPVSMVIVLDNSYSMGYIDKGRSRFEQAREAAIGLLGTLKPGDEVIALLANEQVEPLLPDFTSDHERAKAALRQAKLSVLGTNLDPALREALRLANKASGAAAAAPKDAKEPAPKAPGDEKEKRRRREIHLLTDLQASAWEATLKSNFLKTVQTDATLYLTSYGHKGSPNCFIESVAVAGSGPEQCTVTAQVWAVGAGSPGGVATLSVNGKPVVQETFAVRPGAPVPVTLTTRLGGAGTYRCTVSLQEDALAIDDQHYFTAKIGERSKVLVVDGDPSAVAALGETFYLGNALSPATGLVTAPGDEGPAPVDARIITAAELPAAKLDDFRTLILCNVPALDGSDQVKIENFLREGGNLWVFLGGKVNAAHYNDWKFLPITLGQPVGDPTRRQAFEFGEQREGHPLFKTPLDLRSARFFLCVGANRASLKPGAAVLLSFTNGQPALVEGAFGKGKVLLFTSTADADWNNFPLRRAYLPWVHQVIYYLAGADVQGAAFRLREPVKFQALTAQYRERIVVTDPTGRRIVLPPPVLQGGYAECVFKETDLPGLYQVAADPAFTNSGGFGVNLDVKESVITMEDPDKIIAAAPSGMIRFVEGPKRDVVEEVKKSREEEKAWPTLFKLALLLFVLESFFGNLLSRAAKAGGMKLPLFEVLRQRNPGVAQ